MLTLIGGVMFVMGLLSIILGNIQSQPIVFILLMWVVMIAGIGLIFRNPLHKLYLRNKYGG